MPSSGRSIASVLSVEERCLKLRSVASKIARHVTTNPPGDAPGGEIHLHPSRQDTAMDGVFFRENDKHSSIFFKEY
jgi:hypothetical protein